MVHTLSLLAGAPPSLFYVDLLLLGVIVGSIALAVVLARRWSRRRSHVHLLVGLVVLLSIAVLVADLERLRLRNGINQLEIARELRVDPRLVEVVGPYGRFPSSYLLPKITAEVTTRSEVHAILASARARYQCPVFEKYLLLSADYNIDDLDAAQVVNVYYHPNDRVWGVSRVDSADGPGLQGCKPF